jgi:spore coat polysaccharide biosynthesis predicted glycosyltransferase SpsG
MRSLALAQAWKEAGGSPHLLLTEESSALLTRVADEGFEAEVVHVRAGSIEDVCVTSELAGRLGARWIVLDGPQFDGSYQFTLRQKGPRLLVFDDDGRVGYYSADLVVNPNLHAKAAYYSDREPWTRVLLGTPYVPLRNEFLAHKGKATNVPDVAHRILVTLGGSDIRNHTLRVLRSLDRIQGTSLELTVVVGPSNLHADSIKAYAKRARHEVKVVQNAMRMSRYMAGSDLAVSSGGITVWELAFMGVPTIVGATSSVEEKLVEGLRARGLFRVLGRFTETSEKYLRNNVQALILNKEERKQMKKLGPKVVDGHGTKRILSAMMRYPRVGADL